RQQPVLVRLGAKPAPRPGLLDLGRASRFAAATDFRVPAGAGIGRAMGEDPDVLPRMKTLIGICVAVNALGLLSACGKGDHERRESEAQAGAPAAGSPSASDDEPDASVG